RRTRARAVNGRGDPQGGAVALPADHDDDDGCLTRRRAADAEPRHRLRAAPATRLYDGRRPYRQSGANSVHDPGDLYLSRSTVALALWVKESQGQAANAEA